MDDLGVPPWPRKPLFWLDALTLTLICRAKCPRSLAVLWVIWIPLALAKTTCSGYVRCAAGVLVFCDRHHLTKQIRDETNSTAGWNICFLISDCLIVQFNLLDRDFQPFQCFPESWSLKMSLNRKTKMIWLSLDTRFISINIINDRKWPTVWPHWKCFWKRWLSRILCFKPFMLQPHRVG